MSNNYVKVEVSLLGPKTAYDLEFTTLELKKYFKNASNFKNVIEMPDLDNKLSSGVRKIVFEEKISKFPDNVDDIKFYFYHPFIRSYEQKMIQGDEEEDDTCASRHWVFPNLEFEGVYESLVYDNDVKEEILRYTESAIIFGNHHVDKNLISFNKLILLYGPPGTGKTTLCKAIAQKLSIRLNSIYATTHFIEINTHSLFSKWFSESGKLVSKLFNQIHGILEDKNSLICILIDEVESIAYDRCNLSGEPKDALRVVNSVLTQLDQLKLFSNVMVFATSNLAKTIDLAFLDRVDLKKFIGFPSAKAIYSIYISAIGNLIKVGLIATEGQEIPTYEMLKHVDRNGDSNKLSYHLKELLNEIIEKSIGLSGRILKKIPFLAHTISDHSPGQLDQIPLQKFLINMRKAIEDHNGANKPENFSAEGDNPMEECT